MKRPKLTDRRDITEILKGSEPIKQQPPKPANQDSGKPASGLTSKTARRQASKTAAQPNERIKSTFYLEPQDVEALERERFQRRSGGRREDSDLSALVREAIRKTYGS